ncbi:hypothetical protein AMAG_08520 [Allomyces macrogynus ATCC 38327]|uniref:Uncharacterized protein n=1 Tax=Allomyces macrogynus (strain ATCC 38327) TaxID=578462 RepID=A0A0L0SLJ1_ALLM3|nr:hypothetical protein AMAG_08520 [Allomyces macrogynus ATCC 38327]|eukprot:KNE63387.1 hypothetical protein AMAG_08520 [Allomyces macrogynus ATCC 38327]
MSSAAVCAPIDPILWDLPTSNTLDAPDATNQQAPQENEMAALTAKVDATAVEDTSTVDKVAILNLVEAIGERVAKVLSRDMVIAHTLLLAMFHNKLHDENEANGHVLLYAREECYLTFMNVVAKMATKGASLQLAQWYSVVAVARSPNPSQ